MANELYHHGIIGMKWGVRRFQNADGTRTSAGKAREKQARQVHEDHAKVFDGKKAYELSDAELRNRLNRINNEKQYDDLTSAGKSTVNKLMKNLGTAVTISSAILTLSANSGKINSAVNGVLNKAGDMVLEDLKRHGGLGRFD